AKSLVASNVMLVGLSIRGAAALRGAGRRALFTRRVFTFLTLAPTLAAGLRTRALGCALVAGLASAGFGSATALGAASTAGLRATSISVAASGLVLAWSSMVIPFMLQCTNNGCRSRFQGLFLCGTACPP